MSSNKTDFVSASEAAKLCGISRQWWNVLYKKGETPEPVHKGGYMNLWKKTDVLRWKQKA